MSYPLHRCFSSIDIGHDAIVEIPMVNDEEQQEIPRAAEFLRFGRELPPSFLRFGRTPSNFLRFGREPSSSKFLRFGRGGEFLRFG